MKSLNLRFPGSFPIELNMEKLAKKASKFSGALPFIIAGGISVIPHFCEVPVHEEDIGYLKKLYLDKDMLLKN
ncbi:MAG: hypothetical protein CMH64_00595 [Nanoarchaeota archaeon]|nr:hypothetical protein [Nanoarchaeota archaeon]|tara:strand:+ start:963 stop:1181 length:219 start_codon:yes stop_codon:yes gene_type:complete